MNDANVDGPEMDDAVSENEQIAQRRQKLSELRKTGVAYPNGFRRDVVAACLHGQYQDTDAETLNNEKPKFKIAGRIMTRRVMGKASFVHLQDMSGRIQVYVRKNDLPEGQYDQFKTWDIGDIIGVEGHVFRTKTGELSLYAGSIQLLTKALRPLPDKWHGLSDQEKCYRQRYVDLIVNEKTRKTFKTRSKIISGIRDYLVQQQFMEVETPMMHVIPGGATAKPFVTHHNALDMQLFLRIAPELYLKRLIVGGFERVFEINRSFRNEGLSTRHNPEFTMLEFYGAYLDYHDLMDMTEAMLKQVAEKVLGRTQFSYQGQEIDFGKSFKRQTLKASIKEFNTDLSDDDLESDQKLRSHLKSLGIEAEKNWGLGKLQLEIFEKTVEHELKDPCFITEYPAEVSPLARRSDRDPFVTDRFELFVGGREIANGFSELNDPDDQAERFSAQVAAKDAGDEEAMHFDDDYITAMEYGMAPTAGEGIGIDRLTMLLTDSPSIRDVILFPHMRPIAP